MLMSKEDTKMYVIKRNGEHVELEFDAISTRNKEIAIKLNILQYIDISKLSYDVIKSLKSGMKTSEIDELSAETSYYQSGTNPHYGTLSLYIAVTNLHKETGKFLECINSLITNNNQETKVYQPLISKNIYDFAISNIDIIQSNMDYTRDFLFDYFGLKTLMKSYLQSVNNKTTERPQDMFMRVSLGIHGPYPNSDKEYLKCGNIAKAMETYKEMSLHKFIHASPTLFNCGTMYSQNASCFLMVIPDSIEGMYDYFKKIALISKRGGGIGIDLTGIRGKGSLVNSTGGKCSGILPVARILNEECRHVSQGKRNGSFAVYLQPWHIEIKEFLELKLPNGNPELRTRNLFTGLWNCDIFMERVERNEMWSLFCPGKVDLIKYYGEEFNSKYLEYEEKKLYSSRIKARVIYDLVLESRMKTGVPYMLYKDSINRKNPQQNIGIIRSSNLCCEIVEYTDENHVSVCNLASVSLPKFVNNGIFDFKELGRIVEMITENCDRLIDINLYTCEEAKKANNEHRPIGIGVQGLADVYQMLEYPWESKEARELNENIFSTMYYHALNKSIELSIKLGPYCKFLGSPASKGILQFDMWKISPCTRIISEEKWRSLKKNIITYGLRNSMLIAPMPTATTSQILGNNECIEPYTYNIYCRATLAGTFFVFNKHLYNKLNSMDLWNNEMAKMIENNQGSIQDIDIIPDSIKKIFKTVWEIPQKEIIDQSYSRSPYIDQTQSLNIHFAKPTKAKITCMDFYAWKKGLKTGCYYLRSKSAMDAVNFSNMKSADKFEENDLCSIGCESCSS